MVEWIHRSEEPDDASPQIRKCGVDVSFNANGDPHSAVSRLQISESGSNITYEAQIVFRIQDDVAYFRGVYRARSAVGSSFQNDFSCL